jgi:CRISPR-associated protein Csx16
MTHWFISRHPGACEWMAGLSIAIDHVVAHLDPADIVCGDVVYGSLPVNLAVQVCERGARYFHLSLVIPFELRGKELSAGQLATMGARFEEFDMRRVAAKTVDAAADLACAADLTSCSHRSQA